MLASKVETTRRELSQLLYTFILASTYESQIFTTINIWYSTQNGSEEFFFISKVIRISQSSGTGRCLLLEPPCRSPCHKKAFFRFTVLR